LKSPARVCIIWDNICDCYLSLEFYEFAAGSELQEISDCPDYRHIDGAYCLPEHRGKGVFQNLLNFAIRTLKAENYTRLGVDFESINPTAYGFWMKYFTPYTHSVVRRIDEKILETYS
jgi:GNAT superfamily N-acetyltransferase